MALMQVAAGQVLHAQQLPESARKCQQLGKPRSRCTRSESSQFSVLTPPRSLAPALIAAAQSLICNFIWIVWNSYGDIPAAAHAPAAPAIDGEAFVAPADDKHAHPTTTPTVTVASA